MTCEELLEVGTDSYKRGEFKKAQVLFGQLIENDPKNVDAYFYLANIFHRNGEIGKAIRAFKKVLELDPSHTDASISLSVLYNDIGKYDEAKKIFETANERVKKGKSGGLLEDQHINKKFSMKHFELADLYLTYNRYDEAIFEYKKAIDLDPENLPVRIKIAKVYAKKGFHGKAFEDLRKIKNEYPDYGPARLALGILHYGNGNILEAQTEWENVISRDPRNEEAAMYLNLSKMATETNLTN